MTTLLDELHRAPTCHAVEGELNYLASGQGRPVFYTYEPPAGTPWSTGEFEPTRVTIRDARPRAAAGEFSLDVSGFQLVSHRSAVGPDDFGDESVVRLIYYPEAEALLRETTGAEKVVIFDHTLRDSESGSRANTSLREPSRRVHNDQTFMSAPRRVRDHLSVEEAGHRLQHRFAIVNLWRPLSVVERLPLALCDARTMSPDDIVPSDIVYRDRVGENYLLVANAAHRWYYFPRLRPDEALLLKIYDSLDDGTARLTPHTAFDDPTTPADAPPRRSIELRALLFWGE